MEKLDAAIESVCPTIFLLTGSIFNLKNTIDRIHIAEKKVYIDIDLMEGFSKDATFLEYIHDVLLPDGIITTRTMLAKKAKAMNTFVIQRFFVFDSMSLKSAVNTARESQPDVIEILPGVIPKVITEIKTQTNKPIISSGLISSLEDIAKAIDAGAMGVTTGRIDFWGKNKK